jgi:hypothetical protein
VRPRCASVFREVKLEKVVMAAKRPDFCEECAWEDSNLRPTA